MSACQEALKGDGLQEHVRLQTTYSGDHEEAGYYGRVLAIGSCDGRSAGVQPLSVPVSGRGM